MEGCHHNGINQFGGIVKKVLKLGETSVGDEHPVFIIAELSANHQQKYDTAARTVEAAKAAGADVFGDHGGAGKFEAELLGSAIR